MILILMVEGARAVISTCTPTPSCPEAPPCTPVLLTACRRRSPPLLPPPSRSRSSLPPSASTPSGSEAPSWPRSPPSSRCGSPSRSTTSPAPPSCAASASKRFKQQQQKQQHQQQQQYEARQPLRDDHYKLFCNNPLSHCSNFFVSCWLILYSYYIIFFNQSFGFFEFITFRTST